MRSDEDDDDIEDDDNDNKYKQRVYRRVYVTILCSVLSRHKTRTNLYHYDK